MIRRIFSYLILFASLFLLSSCGGGGGGGTTLPIRNNIDIFEAYTGKTDPALLNQTLISITAYDYLFLTEYARAEGDQASSLFNLISSNENLSASESCEGGGSIKLVAVLNVIDTEYRDCIIAGVKKNGAVRYEYLSGTGTYRIEIQNLHFEFNNEGFSISGDLESYFVITANLLLENGDDQLLLENTTFSKGEFFSYNPTNIKGNFYYKDYGLVELELTEDFQRARNTSGRYEGYPVTGGPAILRGQDSEGSITVDSTRITVSLEDRTEAETKVSAARMTWEELLEFSPPVNGGAEPVVSHHFTSDFSVIDYYQVESARSIELSSWGSSDPENSLLEFEWSFSSTPQGSQAILENTDRPLATFHPDQMGLYSVQLRVFDGVNWSVPESFDITIGTADWPFSEDNPRFAWDVPEEFLFQDINILTTFDVTITAPDNAGDDFLKYNYLWQIVSAPDGSQATLTNDESKQVAITPDLPGEYAISLVIDNGLSQTDEKIYSFTAEDYDLVAKPVIQSGDWQNLFSDGTSPVELRAYARSLYGPAVTGYDWTLISSPAGSSASIQLQADGNSVLATDTAGIYQVGVIASDGLDVSEQVIVNVYVTDRAPFVERTHSVLQQTVAAGVFPTALATGDFNLDGRIDIAATFIECSGFNCTSDSEFKVFEQTPTAEFSPPSITTTGNLSTTINLTTSDLDKDGKTELIIDNDWGTATLDVYEADTNGNFTLIDQINKNSSYVFSGHQSGIRIADVNSDGLDDIFWTSQNILSLIQQINSPGLLSFTNTHTHTFREDVTTPEFADINGDGTGEIVVAYSTYDSNWNAQGHIESMRYESGQLSPATTYTLPDNFRLNRGKNFVMLDADQDSDMDIVGIGTPGETLHVVSQSQGNHFLPNEIPLHPVSGVSVVYEKGVYKIDMDMDGIMDVVYVDGLIYIFYGSAEGGFSDAEKIDLDVHIKGHEEDIDFGDLDGDTDPDIAVIVDNEIRTYYNPLF